MITITEKAIKAVKSISDDEGIGYYIVRLKVKGGGCAGFTYDMYFDDLINEADEVIETDGIKVVVDPLSVQYLEGVTVDFVDDTYGRGFKFINPNATGSCGCGSSFSV
jgi:iron-sulfur cluster insertion protein